MLLDGRVAVITGSASGIGRTAAILFAAEGARVVVSDIDDQRGHEVVSLIKESDNEAIYCHADVSIVSDLEKLVATTVKTCGKLNIFWHNADVEALDSIQRTAEEVFDNKMAVQLKGGFFGAKFAIPEMVKAGGGCIIFTGSAAGLRPMQNTAPAHAVAKAGLVMLTKVLALPCGKKNIRVNCICPGAVDTPGLQQMRERYPEGWKVLEKLYEQTPLGRHMTMDEIAEAGLFLASDKASGITGVALPVDGGRTV
jgi:NAD(P)-dependent dehydrogenase (short-subunit alcohol dehydrogenase family)